MDLKSIGKHIRESRIVRGMSQEQLAEDTRLSVSYIGMIERGEKIPRLETFLRIINTLEVSSDEVMKDVVRVGYQIRMSEYTERIRELSERDQKRVYDLLEIMLEK